MQGAAVGRPWASRIELRCSPFAFRLSLRDYVGTHDGRDHLHPAAAIGAPLRVDPEGPLEQLRP